MSQTRADGARRQKAQAARLAARRRQRQRQYAAVAAVVVVLVLVGVLIVVKLAGGGRHPTVAGGAAVVPAGVLTTVTSVPLGTLTAVGMGSANALPQKLPATAAALTSGGKPSILYVGAEYCPFCAAERWAVVVALSRFGTWHGLTAIHSSGTDIYPNTATFSFAGATYTSRYVAFTGKEIQSNQVVGGQYAPLDTLTPQEQQLFSTYDSPPYVSAANKGSIPFVDFGNRYLVSGASYSPGVLAGKTMAQIAGSLADPTNPVARGVDGAANVLTATVCQLTGNQPASVCDTPTITGLAARLRAGK